MKKAMFMIAVLMLAGCSAPASDSNSGGSAAESTAEAQVQETAAAEAVTSLSAEEVDQLLNGTWAIPDGSGEFSFDHGSLAVTGNGQMLSGTYEVDVDESAVIGHISASNGTLKITIPYTYENGELHVFNNRNVELVKK